LTALDHNVLSPSSLSKIPAVLNKGLPRLEALLAKSKSGRILASGELSYADILLAELLHGNIRGSSLL
jgi:hypothetical protein